MLKLKMIERMYFFLLYNDCENEGPFKYFYKGVKECISIYIF
ncbi:hypothetical protein BC30090_2370 [Bacillus cereus]|uniref:Uncharacterized protein n=1 Tax=Bacillus paranthracis TaxID=2026186 RepID=A0A9X8XBM0_9BACI|nr:hypothetical protein II9_02982 [Bacillus cereus MSX-D12]EJR49431.1 hypothetical protein IIK_02286 [Bacillus cereus VD102]KKC56915.1 hypothetical protein OA45_00551 [Bacillus sp. UMTAT18]SME53728.1 hypothetical protein BACERE00221_05596 [Bacillus paranthracis]BCD23473.1 hypothetical protein BC30090_2370 [Bacillus cereus]